MQLLHYTTPDGDCPLLGFLESLRDKVELRALLGRLNRLERGVLGDHRYLREGVWELRVHAGPGYRVYYSLTGMEVVVLLCAGDKGSQSADIERAIRYWMDFKRRSI